jgi:hypothetical protein
MRLAYSFVVLLLVLLTALGCDESVATEDIAPRMWRVTGVGANGQPLDFYLFGVTHQGLSVEYDRYFSERVVPAFLSASYFADESAVVVPQALPACKGVSLAVGEEEAIATARAHLSDLVTRFHDEVNQRSARVLNIPPPASFREYGDLVANGMSEFGLINAIAQYRGRLASLYNGPSSRVAGFDGRAPAAVLREMRPELKAGSLDSAQDFVDVFCALGDARVALLKATVQQDEAHDVPYDSDALVAEATADFLRTFADQRSRGVFRTDERFYGQFLCARNRNWLRKMLERGDGISFYAVGGSHLFPDEDGAQCAGLLKDLAQRGLSVVPINP